MASVHVGQVYRPTISHMYARNSRRVKGMLGFGTPVHGTHAKSCAGLVRNTLPALKTLPALYVSKHQYHQYHVYKRRNQYGKPGLNWRYRSPYTLVHTLRAMAPAGLPLAHQPPCSQAKGARTRVPGPRVKDRAHYCGHVTTVGVAYCGHYQALGWCVVHQPHPRRRWLWTGQAKPRRMWRNTTCVR